MTVQWRNDMFFAAIDDMSCAAVKMTCLCETSMIHRLKKSHGFRVFRYSRDGSPPVIIAIGEFLIRRFSQRTKPPSSSNFKIYRFLYTILNFRIYCIAGWDVYIDIYTSLYIYIHLHHIAYMSSRLICTWWFPEIGISPNHPFIDGFSL